MECNTRGLGIKSLHMAIAPNYRADFIADHATASVWEDIINAPTVEAAQV